jgi:hypothetical protein
MAYTSTGVRTAWLKEQQNAPAKAYFAYRDVASRKGEASLVRRMAAYVVYNLLKRRELVLFLTCKHIFIS